MLTKIRQLRDGNFLVQRLCPEHAKLPFIVTRTETGRFVLALINKPEVGAGKRLVGYTAMLSWGDLAQLWAKTMKVQVKFREVSIDEFKKSFPVDGEELLSASSVAEFGFTGRDPEVLEPKDLGIDDRPDDVEKWLAAQDWSAVLQAKEQDI